MIKSKGLGIKQEQKKKEDTCVYHIKANYFAEVEKDHIVDAYDVETECGISWTMYDYWETRECPWCHRKIVIDKD